MAALDLDLLRAIHLAVTGRPSNVRRANEDGSWGIVAPKPGRLRSRPQAFRMGDHIERAWDHVTLRRNLADLLRSVRADDGNPFLEAARVMWTVLRAQPFLGLNERTALVLAGRMLHAVGLPVFHVVAVEHDPDFARAVIRDHHDALAGVIERAGWQEALEFAEWLGLPPSGRWSLRDEQQALAVARSRVIHIDPGGVEEVVRYLAVKLRDELRDRLHTAVEPCEVAKLQHQEHRLEASIASARSGRYVCAQLPVTRLRWVVSSAHGLVAEVVIGSAGRGITGAVSIHMSLGIVNVATPHAPSMLLVPAETEAERRRRIDSWIARALPVAIGACPLRC
ncbi:MAG: Fic family protein [Kofleriaceae bacterium]